MSSIGKLGWLVLLAFGVVGYGYMRWDDRRPQPVARLNGEQAYMARDGGHVVGSGPVEVVMFSSYSCPYCQEAWGTLGRIVDVDDPKLSIRIRHLVTDTLRSPDFKAAIAAECAAIQGRFEPYHRALFDSWSGSDHQEFARLAVQVGMPDLDRFFACVSSDDAKAAIIEDLRTAAELEIAGVPAFIVHDALFLGASSVMRIHEFARESL